MIKCDTCNQDCSPLVIRDSNGDALDAVSSCCCGLLLNSREWTADWTDIELAGYDLSPETEIYNYECNDADVRITDGLDF